MFYLLYKKAYIGFFTRLAKPNHKAQKSHHNTDTHKLLNNQELFIKQIIANKKVSNDKETKIFLDIKGLLIEA